MKRKFAIIKKPKKIIIEEDEISASEEEVIIKISACGLCSWEIFHFNGIFGCPCSIGHEAVGTVIETGKNVKDFKPGDRVTGFFGPGFSDYAVANQSSIIKLPDDIPIEHALGEPLACCINVLRAAEVEPGDFALVIGSGFMGLMIISLLAHSGATEIIAVDIAERKLSIAKECGANWVVNPKTTDLKSEVEKITHGHGIDVAFECSGKDTGINLIGPCMRNGRGRIMLVTSTEPNKLVSCKIRDWEGRGSIVIGAHPRYSYDQMDDLRRAISCLEKGIFPMGKVITHKFKLEDIQLAFETLESKPEGYIKGIVIP